MQLSPEQFHATMVLEEQHMFVLWHIGKQKEFQQHFHLTLSLRFGRNTPQTEITTMPQANLMREMGSQLSKQEPSRRTDVCQDILTARMSTLSA